MQRASDTEQEPDSGTSRFDIWDVIATIYAGRAAFFTVAAVALTMALAYLQLAPREYTATARGVWVVPDSNSSGLAALAKLSGLQTQANDFVTPFTVFRYMLNSHELAERLIQKHDMLRKVYRKKWDAGRHKWKLNEGVAGMVRVPLFRLIGKDPWAPPLADDLARFIGLYVHLDSIDKSGVYAISFEDRDPQFARELINDIIVELDGLIAQRQYYKATQYSHYLERRISQTQEPDLRTALGALYLQQEQYRMTASSGMPVAAEIVDPASVSDQPTSPDPGVVLGWAFSVILFFGSLAAYAYEKWLRMRLRGPRWMRQMHQSPATEPSINYRRY